MTKKQTVLILIAALMPLLFMNLYHFNWEVWDTSKGDNDNGGYMCATIMSGIGVVVTMCLAAFRNPRQRA